MKNILNVLFLSIALLMGGSQLRMLVVKTTPEMHCNKCETKIKKHMMYERGITKIETSLERQTVTFTYDARKTNAENITKAMSTIGYECKVVKDVPKEKEKDKKKK